NDGDVVKLDEIICSIESDKATLDIAAPSAGRLKILVGEGETVAIGTQVAQIDETVTAGAATATATATVAESTPATTPSASQEKLGQGAKNYPSPSASKILAEKGIDPSSIEGSGKDGRITKADALGAQKVQSTGPDKELKDLALHTMSQS